MATITYPLLTVLDDAGDVVTGLVAGTDVTITSVKDSAGTTITSPGATLHISDANVSVDYDAVEKGEAWITLLISKSGSNITGWNATPSFFLAKDPAWLRSLGTATADSTIHVLAVKPTNATHYRVECLSGSTRQWWNGTTLVDTEPNATALPGGSDRSDGLLSFDVTGLPAGEYAVAFFPSTTGTVVGTPIGATVGGGAASVLIDSPQLANIAQAVLDGAYEGSMTLNDYLKLTAAVLLGNSTHSGLYFVSPADDATERIRATVDGSSNRTVTGRVTT